MYRESSGEPLAELVFDNNGQADSATTELSGEQRFAADLRVGAGAVVGPPMEGAGFHLSMDGNVTIDEGGAISADGRGFAPGEGPGAGASGGGFTSSGAGGGGHGGAGGDAAAVGGGTYGSPLEPTDLGSGGGSKGCGLGGSYATVGSAGGGAIQLTVGGVLTVNGVISANGDAGKAGCAGSGSGGSLWITTETLEGAGQIKADGGSTENGAGAGGGGGRIAIYSCSVLMPASQVTADGGTDNQGNVSGETGTVKYGSCTQLLVTSSDRGWAFGGTGEYQLEGPLSDQLTALNSGPPPSDANGWIEIVDFNDPTVEPDRPARRRAHPEVIPPTAFVCGESDDALREMYVAASDHLLDVDEVTYDNCGSAFFRFTFDLPPDYVNPSLSGVANVDDQAVVFLNGHQISGTMHNGVKDCDPGPCALCYIDDNEPDCVVCNPDSSNGALDPCFQFQDASDGDVATFDDLGRQILTWHTQDRFGTSSEDYFVAGENELVFAVAGDASFFEPTGLEFKATIRFD